jgi:hypothetical protein
MKHLDIETLNVVAVSVEAPQRMNGKERRLRWAYLVRMTRNPYLTLFHELERFTRHDLGLLPIHSVGPSAFSIACSDPILQREGLKPNANVLEIMSFFEITQHQLHEFSCDCGGSIDNDEMAYRIASL